jgi:multidrug efflux pump subunit AcrA (membrane-fusion protein)
VRLPRKGATAAVAVSAVLLTGCTGDSSGIQVAAVGRSTVSEVVEAPATVQAAASTTVTSPATGTVESVLVRDGERVVAGTLMFTISSPQAEAQLAQARSALAQVDSAAPGSPTLLTGGAQTQADTAAEGAFTAARTAAAGIPDPRLKAAALTRITAAERQYQLAAAQARAAIAAINSGIGNLNAAIASLTAAQRVQAQTAVQVAQNAVDALDVTAPIDGTVQLGGSSGSGQGGSADLGDVLSQLPADEQQQATSALGGGAVPTGGSSGGGVQTTGPVTAGTPVSAGTTLATIVDVSSLSLQADVDETDVFLVKPGVKADAELDAVPGGRYPATVASVGLSPTQSARGGVSYRARLTLAGGTMPDGSRAPTPRPGMSAVADLQVRTAKDAVSVPATAIVRDGDRDAVWVVEDARAHRRNVTVGTQGEDQVAVTAGLRVGEQVVVRGVDQVREGQELS